MIRRQVAVVYDDNKPYSVIETKKDFVVESSLKGVVSVKYYCHKTDCKTVEEVIDIINKVYFKKN